MDESSMEYIEKLHYSWLGILGYYFKIVQILKIAKKNVHN